MNKLVEVQSTKDFSESFLNDIFFRMAVNRVLDAAPAAAVSVVTGAEKQAIFRLGQMDMRDSMVAMLREAANRSSGMIKADYMEAADMIAEMKL